MIQSFFLKLQNSPYFLRIQARASSPFDGLDRGWKRRVRLGRDAKFFLSCEARVLRACETLKLR